MTRFCFRITGLSLLILTATALIAQRGGGRGGDSGLGTVTAMNLIVHGSVSLPDGVVPGRLVRVAKVCGDHAEHATFADSKGRFTLDLGRRSFPSARGGKGAAAAEIKPCSIRASLSGFRAPDIPLDAGNNQKTNVGEFQLQPIGKAEAVLLSATDGDVPKDALKFYQKGLDAAADSKWKDAISAMEKATSNYPKFATAWLSLGMLQTLQDNVRGGANSYARAIAADEKFAPAYVEAAVLEATAGQWDKVIEHTSKAISLAPDSLAGAYYLNAMAYVRLNKTDIALKTVTQGLAVDQYHEYPDLAYIDGVLLMKKGDRNGARTQFQNFLSLAPDGVNAVNARELVKELTPKQDSDGLPVLPIAPSR